MAKRFCSALLLAMLLAAPVQAQTPVGGVDAAARVEPLAENTEIPSEWSFSLRPYFFLSGLSGSVTVDPVTFPINSSFANMMKRVKLGGFISFTAEKDRWGVSADFQYINLYGESSLERHTALDLKNIIGEVDLLYRPEVAPTLNFLIGARVYSIIQNVTLLGQLLPEASTTVVDPILGAYGSWVFHDRWGFELRGDIGGFGLSSEFTYQMMALFRWDINDTLSIPFGYRVLGYQIKKENIWMNTRMSGAVLGLDVRF